jgi:hypothetical protein
VELGKWELFGLFWCLIFGVFFKFFFFKFLIFLLLAVVFLAFCLEFLLLVANRIWDEIMFVNPND